MNIYATTKNTPKKKMFLFVVIDVSGSMVGTRIAKVNVAMAEILPDIKKMVDENQANVDIAILTFGDDVSWIPYKPIDIHNFQWHDLKITQKRTNFGMACKELNEKLSRTAFMSSASSSYAPVIILISDGYPTDDYKTELENLKRNTWFRAAVKTALVIEKGYRGNVFADFTGNPKSVIESDSFGKGEIEEAVQFIMLTSMEIGELSKYISEEEKTEIFLKEKEAFHMENNETEKIDEEDMIIFSNNRNDAKTEGADDEMVW